ncbi:Mitochondrial inner membrane magnesium transporter mrs2 [Wickerhamomyces ciferrii]|uniref:Magnesium transporter n=1 Tax=Wickerhamomyces ciferrii (strain ATCC 14091 / BCRC 22168 / CBS 111 / JCM 3599 / NBRC 0793 / NRRL Y-1031 F-60-10) TaxID=1206466 RepID=K0KIV9_WICCF|nr:Mitochondrial inner membrane magnesium transporter mrs2 [Wickerhamomyces ciferrii]CCH45155.1 Mitochondrial inner membrane magnesium transporter mrs2 [Wickerhamomyces ciferrii]
MSLLVSNARSLLSNCLKPQKITNNPILIPTIKRYFGNTNHFKVDQSKNSLKSYEYTSVLLEKNLVHRNHLNPTEATVLRCTVFDAEGKLEALSTDVKRADLISNHGLFPRDLRKIEKIGYNTEIAPSISVRKDSIVITLLHIRALIKADTVIIFDDLGSRNSHAQTQFINDLENKLKAKNVGLPYEIRALEAVMVSAMTNLDAEMKVQTTVTKGILNELEDDITREKLRYLLIQNKKISTFSQRATLVRDVIDEILDNDDDLAGMYLTEKLKGTPRNVDDHAEVEMLLESYYMHCDEIVQTINSTISNVRTTEEIINIILDSNRNQLMLLGLRFSIGLLSMGAGLFVAAAYGMNLENFIEEDDYGFGLIVGISMVSIVILFAYSLKNLNKLQKITIGDHYRQKIKDQLF